MNKRTCTYKACEKIHYGKGLCRGHYSQWLRGQQLRPLRPQLTVEQRFWAKVDKHAPGGCWIWIASTASTGYGQMRIGNRMRSTHRLAWEFTKGDLPIDAIIDHRCSEKRCVNPDHLRLVTQGQNLQHRKGASSRSKSGIRGVSWHKKGQAWCVQVTLNRRTHWGGLHSTLEEAEAAAKALRAKLFTHDDHDQWFANQTEGGTR